MYQNKFVCAIKVGGRILRETAGTVHIPFGSEYSVYLRNLNAVRAKFKLQIDGKDATSDTWIVIPANTAVELERYITNGDWNSGRRFKFIERTAEIEAHRGIGGEDGLVRVEFQVEQVPVKIPVPQFEPYPVPYPVPDPYPWKPSWPRPRRYGSGPLRAAGGQHTNSGTARAMRHSGGLTGQSVTNTLGDALGGEYGECAVRSSSTGSEATYTTGEMPMAMPMGGGTEAAAAPQAAIGDVGITVMGSVSNQRFYTVQDFPSSASEVMVLQLRGEVAGKTVETARTVNTKITCSTCGRKSKSDVEFCAGCGAALVA